MIGDQTVIHAVMYRDYQLGAVCCSEPWVEGMKFSTVTDDATCPACRIKLDGGTNTTSSDDTLLAIVAFHEAWADTNEDEIRPTALWESLARILRAGGLVA
jgi:hypothetical protein